MVLLLIKFFYLFQELEGQFGRGNANSAPKFSPANLVQIASDTNKPLYRLNKKELDEHVKAQGGK